MILGMSTADFTLLHTIISVIAILSGFIVLGAMYANTELRGWTALFLFFTALTSITGFFFPNAKVTPGQVFGALTLIIMVPTLIGLYGFHLRGLWRWIYVGGAVIILFLNSFVGIAQTFAKVPVLQPLQNEPPFLISEAILLAVFAVLGILALIKFHPARVTV